MKAKYTVTHIKTIVPKSVMMWLSWVAIQIYKTPRHEM